MGLKVKSRLKDWLELSVKEREKQATKASNGFGRYWRHAGQDITEVIAFQSVFHLLTQEVGVLRQGYPKSTMQNKIAVLECEVPRLDNLVSKHIREIERLKRHVSKLKTEKTNQFRAWQSINKDKNEIIGDLTSKLAACKETKRHPVGNSKRKLDL